MISDPDFESQSFKNPPAVCRAFYEETDPAVRAGMLQAQDMQNSPDMPVIREFFRHRHPHQRKPETEDAYLQIFFDLIRLSKDSGSTGYKTKPAISQLHRILERFGCLGKTEGIPAAFYWELRNALRRFLEITDKETYGSRFMGMIRLKKEEQQEHACVEIWHILHGLDLLTKNVRLEELLRPAKSIRQTLTEEYSAHDENAAARLHHVSLVMQAGKK